jgi:acyl transferase domain-containing protein
MPSSVSQAQLIRQTYARAGLSTDKDRCQYFEAHGTGTKAGDPQEASAIYQAFFGDKETQDPNDVLYVGSIKTVIGHTEGTAGIAGLLRASLAMKNGFIPPNMLFEELNPDIEPYYGKLEILKAAKPWPQLPPGVPKRASVNSFGKLLS